MKLNTRDESDFVEGAERQRATETGGVEPPRAGTRPRGEEPEGEERPTGSAAGTQRPGTPSHGRTPYIAARSAARPPQPAWGWKKSAPGAWPGGRESGGFRRGTSRPGRSAWMPAIAKRRGKRRAGTIGGRPTTLGAHPGAQAIGGSPQRAGRRW